MNTPLPFVKKQLLVLAILLLPAVAFCQVTFNSTVPSSTTPLEVCNIPRLFSVTVTNNGGTAITGNQLTITLPHGINYVAGSVTGAADANIINLEAPVFNVADIAAGASAVITYQARAYCERINEPVNTNSFSLTGSAGTFSDVTASYNVSYAALTVTSVTNNNYSGTAGDVFTRTISVTNGGFGRVQEIKVDEYNNGWPAVVNITGVSAGVASSAAFPTNSTTFTITDFTGTGNGDAFFDNGETISFTETITTGSACYVAPFTTNYIAYYGCFNRCPVTNSTDIAGYYTGNINLAGTNYTTSWDLNATTPNPFPVCPSDVLHESFTLTNNGNGGAATNVKLTVMHASTDEGQYINNVKINGVAVSTTVTEAVAPGCFTSIPPGAGAHLETIIPSVSAGETITVTFDLYRCANASFCSPGVRSNIENYLVEMLYTDACGNTNQSYSSSRLGYDGPSAIHDGNVQHTAEGTDYPVYVKDTETKSFCYTFTFQPPAFDNSNAYMEWLIPLPAGITFKAGNHVALTDIYTGTINIAPGYPLLITGGGSDTLKIRFNTTDLSAGSGNWPGWGKYELCVDLSGVAGTGCGQQYVITPFMRFSPGGSCNNFSYKYFCDPNSSAQSWYPQHICTPVPCEGANNVSFETRRISYGLADNNNDNIYDGSGTVDLSKINLKDVMPGDTIMGIYKAVILNPAAANNWKYAAMGLLVGNDGKTLSNPKFYNANVKIWDASAGAYLTLSCSSIAPVDSAYGDDLQVYYNFSSCLPAGFTFNTGDSILVDFTFQHRLNAAADTKKSMEVRVFSVSPRSFVSAVPQPYYDHWNQPASQMGCGFTPDYYKHHQVWAYLSNVGAVNPGGCEPGSLTYSFQGGLARSTNCNVKESFPYEIRRPGIFKKFTLALPTNAVFDHAVYNAVNPDCSSTTSAPLIPSSTSPGSVTFDLAQLYTINGGLLNYIGERNEAVCQIFFKDACDDKSFWDMPAVLEVATESPASSVLLPSYSYVSTYAMQVSAANYTSLETTTPSYLSASDTAEWFISVGAPNASISLPNTWLAKKPGISGVNILSVTPVICGTSTTDGADIMPNSNGIYELGATDIGIAKCFKVKATFNSCVKDSVKFIAGYDCNAYPTSVSNPALLCNYDELTLYAASNPSIQLQQLITVDAGSNIHSLCDTLNYNLSVTSAQTGIIRNIKTSFVMTPTNAVNVVSGSSQIEYPHGSGTWLALPDPVLTGSTYAWNISAAPSLASTLGTTGLPGVMEAPYNRFNIRFKAVTLPCNFKSDATFLFITEGTKPCGARIYATDQITEPVKISGAPTPYNTYTVRLNNEDASMCNDQISTVRFAAINKGPFTSSAAEFIDFVVYTGAAAVGGITQIHNAPTGIPAVINAPGGTIYRVAMPAGVAIGDSIVFTVPVRINDNISCDTNRIRIEANTNMSFTATCISTGQSCNIGQITGQDNDNFINIVRTSLELSNLSAYTTLNPPSGEIVHASVWLKNTGSYPVTTSTPVTLQFYHDANLNGQVNAGETLLGSQVQNINVNPGDSVLINFTQTIPAGSICPLLATIAKTACICSVPVVSTTEVPVKPDSLNITVCAGVTTAPVGSAAVNGYSYRWTAVTPGGIAYLSDPNIASPTFNKPTNTSGGAQYITYQLYIDRGPGCAGVQTIIVKVDDPANCANGTIGDYVWKDINGNGLQDDGLSNGINGITVQLWNAADGIEGNGNDILVGTTTTANDGSSNPGYYLFENIASGDYYIKFPLAYNGYGLTSENSSTGVDGNSDANTATGITPIFNINTGSAGHEKNNSTIDAGYLTPTIIGDKVWKDEDADGLQDAGEPGMANITVTLYTSTNAVVSTTTTDAFGNYAFSNIPAGDYMIGFTLPSGYRFTSSSSTDLNNPANSDANQTTGFTSVFTVIHGETENDIDAGMYSITPLPVTGISLNATLIANTSSIEWTAIAEVNTDYYLVERSMDGRNFIATSIRIAARSNNGRTYSYNTTDNIGSFTGNAAIFYRIKAVSKEGKTVYSNTAVVKLDKAAGVSIWPNPAKSSVYVNVTSSVNGIVEAKLLDIKGKQVLKKTYKVQKGNNQFIIDGLNGYAKGIYILEINNNNEINILRIIKE
ncbi:MAG: SdrD B-like domain-containing protein [Ferruginibacter sp.]